MSCDFPGLWYSHHWTLCKQYVLFCCTGSLCTAQDMNFTFKEEAGNRILVTRSKSINSNTRPTCQACFLEKFLVYLNDAHWFYQHVEGKRLWKSCRIIQLTGYTIKSACKLCVPYFLPYNAFMICIISNSDMHDYPLVNQNGRNSPFLLHFYLFSFIFTLTHSQITTNVSNIASTMSKSGFVL